MKYTFLTVIIALVFYACGTSKKQKTEADMEKNVGKVATDTTINFEDPNKMTDLAAGGSIYRNQCTLCHEEKNIKAHSYQEWVEIVEDMSKRVNKKLGREDITPQREAQLLSYIAKFTE